MRISFSVAAAVGQRSISSKLVSVR